VDQSAEQIAPAETTTAWLEETGMGDLHVTRPEYWAGVDSDD
jgi:hypothetical protein